MLSYKQNKKDNICLLYTSEVYKRQLLYKRNDLTYTVNYLERNTNRILATSKVVTNQTYGKEINTLTEVIEIDGYTYANVETATLKIDTSENILKDVYKRQK